MTEMYTGTKKSDWLRCLETYHSLCRTRSKSQYPIKRLRSDYGSELQSHKADDWMQKEGIVFEPSAQYSQEQNGVPERMGRTIMDMTRATILERNIDDDLWPELVLTMTYIKNNRPTRALQGNISPHEVSTKEAHNLAHLRVLGSTVYVLLHEEERSMKPEKWAPRVLKRVLVGYDGHTIYRVHIKDQKKVIQVKDLRIFEDYKTKASNELPDYDEGKPTFQGFLFEDNDEEGSEELTSTCDKGRKIDNAKGKQSTQTKELTSTCDNGRKVGGIEGKSNSNAHAGRKVNDAETRFHADQKSKDVMQGQSHADQRSKDVMQNQSHADQRSTDVMQK